MSGPDAISFSENAPAAFGHLEHIPIVLTHFVIAGHSASEDARERAYDPAIHPLRKKFLRRTMDYPNSGLPEFGHFSAQVG
jgi:hypothetical protein